MTTLLTAIMVNDSQLFKAQVYDSDGVTSVTPISCTCTIYNRLTGAAVVTNAAGTVGAGYAQYNWSGSASAGEFEAVLSVTIGAGVLKTESFLLDVLGAPIAFTTDLTTEIGQVRMELGDDVPGQGVKPDGRNLADDEIQTLLDREGSVMRCVAAACELLARHWARVANISIGSRREDLGAVAEQWRKQAGELRAQYGSPSEGVTSFSIGAKRADGYSELMNAGEYQPLYHPIPPWEHD